MSSPKLLQPVRHRFNIFRLFKNCFGKRSSPLSYRPSDKNSKSTGEGSNSSARNISDANVSAEWEQFIALATGYRWEVIQKNKKFDDARTGLILDQFQLHHWKGTRFLSKDSSATICLCKEGVFIFAMDFQSACLISVDLPSAVDYIQTPGKAPAGPVKEPGEPYFEENEKINSIGL